MKVVYRLSSAAQVHTAVIRLHKIGATARVLPHRRADGDGRRLEVDIAHDDEGDRSVAIIRQVDPAAHLQGAED